MEKTIVDAILSRIMQHAAQNPAQANDELNSLFTFVQSSGFELMLRVLKSQVTDTTLWYEGTTPGSGQEREASWLLRRTLGYQGFLTTLKEEVSKRITE